MSAPLAPAYRPSGQSVLLVPVLIASALGIALGVAVFLLLKTWTDTWRVIVALVAALFPVVVAAIVVFMKAARRRRACREMLAQDGFRQASDPIAASSGLRSAILGETLSGGTVHWMMEKPGSQGAPLRVLELRHEILASAVTQGLWAVLALLDAFTSKSDKHRNNRPPTRRFDFVIAAWPCPSGWPSLNLSRDPAFKAVTGIEKAPERRLPAGPWACQCGDQEFADYTLNEAFARILAGAPPEESWCIRSGILACVVRGSLNDRDLKIMLKRLARVVSGLPAPLWTWRASAAPS